MILAPKPSESTKAHTFLSKLSPIYTKYNAIRFPKYEYEKKKKDDYLSSVSLNQLKLQ